MIHIKSRARLQACETAHIKSALGTELATRWRQLNTSARDEQKGVQAGVAHWIFTIFLHAKAELITWAADITIKLSKAKPSNDEGK